ncbi:MAG: TIGR01459 family HAD-type hydrolase [Rhizobiales bacterium]|nr:TIGR01459 family HAD-type hydrolase [Hyphomicrobiales bacterium]
MTATILTDIEHFEHLAASYECVLCDIWGVIHDGVTVDMQAVEALQNFKKNGGRVILLTNAPRPAQSVARQLADLGAPDDIGDAIVTSGDVTRKLLQERIAKKIWHLGPERDNGVYAGLSVNLCERQESEVILCTGLFEDAAETPEDYREIFENCITRGQEMICANPDLMVDRGGTLVPCAGALAELYNSLGGQVIYAGKPWRPIYDMAMAIAGNIARDRVLAIGDSIRTDMRGAHKCGFDALFIEGAISATERKDGKTIAAVFAEAGIKPVGVQQSLIW